MSLVSAKRRRAAIKPKQSNSAMQRPPRAGALDVAALGQVFTPEPVVEAMLALRRNRGSVLEPSCGDGAFFARLPGAVGIEIDPRQCPSGALCRDFFAFPETEKFDSIIGNPPYVRFQDIRPATRKLLQDFGGLLDARSNLYLFFIAKAVRHLAPGGELIFITPRDFLKASSAVRLNRWLCEQGAFTDVIELGDSRVFVNAVPNCLIWRYQLGRSARRLRFDEIGGHQSLASSLHDIAGKARRRDNRECVESAGHLLFCRGHYPLRLGDIAQVKVGAVSGADSLYTVAALRQTTKAGKVLPGRDFVYSATAASGKTRRMLWCDASGPPPAELQRHKAALLARRIRRFDETNWWQWGRAYPQSSAPRVYVNHKTRRAEPFFVHPCVHFDGAVLAIFPLDPTVDVAALAAALNGVDWSDLGFLCDGRHLFSQRSLENAPLPASFERFLPGGV